MTDGARLGARHLDGVSRRAPTARRPSSPGRQRVTRRRGPAPTCPPTSPARRHPASPPSSGTPTTPRFETAAGDGLLRRRPRGHDSRRGPARVLDGLPLGSGRVRRDGRRRRRRRRPAGRDHRRGAVYVATTGYGYGDQVSVGLQERLMTLFAGQLDGAVSLGDALRNAKQEYFASQGLYGAYDEKALSSTILYGLADVRCRHRAPGPSDATERDHCAGRRVPRVCRRRPTTRLHLRRRSPATSVAGSRPTPAPGRSCRRSPPVARCSHGPSSTSPPTPATARCCPPTAPSSTAAQPTGPSPTSTPPSAGRRSTTPPASLRRSTRSPPSRPGWPASPRPATHRAWSAPTGSRSVRSWC